MDFAEYLRDLADGLFLSFGVDSNNIALSIDIDVSIADLEMAICRALIVNELVSNSLKHAFPEGRGGEILIALHENNETTATLIVRDDGVGFPKNLDFKNIESLGLQLVNTLSDQLEGEIKLFQESGTSFEIAFDMNNPR